jgi:hypothetical protein
MKIENSLLCLQEPTNCLHPEPNESSLHYQPFFLKKKTLWSDILRFGAYHRILFALFSDCNKGKIFEHT